MATNTSADSAERIPADDPVLEALGTAIRQYEEYLALAAIAAHQAGPEPEWKFARPTLDTPLTLVIRTNK